MKLSNTQTTFAICVGASCSLLLCLFAGYKTGYSEGVERGLAVGSTLAVVDAGAASAADAMRRMSLASPLLAKALCDGYKTGYAKNAVCNSIPEARRLQMSSDLIDQVNGKSCQAVIESLRACD